MLDEHTPRSPALTRTPARTRGQWREVVLVALTIMTAYTTALGWQAQGVSYPLFQAVDTGTFAAYHQHYNDAILWPVLIPGIPTFLVCAVFFWIRPRWVSPLAAALVTVSGILTLVLTLLWAIPMHDRLDSDGFTAATLDSLLQANLLRSVVLTCCTVLLGRIVLSGIRRQAA